MGRHQPTPVLRSQPIAARLGWLVAGAAFLYILFSLVVYAVPSLGEWQGLAFAPIRPLGMLQPPFADLAMLTHSAGCEASLGDLYDGRVNCDPYGRLFTYPAMALWMFQVLGLSAASLGWVGVALGTAVALITGAFFFALIPSPAVAGPLLALAYLSLPFQLTLERANNDLVVYLLLALLALALAGGQRRSAAAAAALGFLAVATKVLPLFGIAATHLVHPGGGPMGLLRPGRTLWALLGALAGLGLVLPWIGPILRNSPGPPGNLLSHGLMAHQVCYDLMTSLNLSGTQSRLLAYGCLGTKLLLLLTGIVAAARLGLPRSLRAFIASVASPDHSRLIAVTVCLFTGTWVGTYLFTRSYDYTFIFLLPVLGLTGALLSSEPRGPSRRGWIALVLAPMLAIWFLPYLAISFNLPLDVPLELVRNVLLTPLLAGALLVSLSGCRPFRRISV
ncbi:hypothetical protein [Synechococcus sp. CCY 9618]|uniref:hypothetical protein n=1 Tax=Synechococcus sp. CCY 9618 TaxID=2815602 RepID=UPI001C22F950|nr:hypothetical protein [Synechococcus sp. CCY 9618]